MLTGPNPTPVTSQWTQTFFFSFVCLESKKLFLVGMGLHGTRGGEASCSE